MKEEKKLTLWERYLTSEIGIEFKSCLYFFAILFFYCVVRMVNGSTDASILHMTEMIFTCYGIGYFQVYVLWNFDEAEKLGIKEIAGMVICTALYCGISYWGKWFDRELLPTLLFALYLMITYICVFYIYYSKRRIDDKKLNEDLKLFQSEHRPREK
ncbi:MAG: DUF3021 domain-containing protein [Lachnospiraceae bacterium]|nr:DUF3021 domain-containing protein [Lachnospiraceae bacterium]